MKYAELKRAMPWAGEHFLRANCEDAGPEPKRIVRHALPRKNKAPAKSGQRYLVRIISHRRRLIDADNLCGKAFVDAVRRSGLIPDDAPEIMDYRISQQKVRTKDEEKTEIIITKINPKTLCQKNQP